MRYYSSTRFGACLFLAPFVVIYLAMAIITAVTPAYEEHVEASVVVIAEQWLNGRPLYHAIDAPYVYSIVYGPAGFLWLAGALKCFSDPILASKLAGGFWAVLSVVVLLVVYRRVGGMVVAVVGLGVVGSEWMASWPVPFWDRPDPLLIFATALGLVALSVRSRVLGAAILAIAIALAIDGKIHGFLYLAPALAVWGKRHGLLECLAISSGGAALSFLPFLLPGISLANYLALLGQVAHHPIRKGILLDNVQALLMSLVPLALFAGSEWKFRGRELKEEAVLFTGLIVAGLLVCIPAAKEGSGPYHLLPFVVYIGYLFCMGVVNLPERLKLSWTTGVFAVWILFSYLHVDFTWSYLMRARHGPDRLIQADLRQLLTKYPAAQTQMGLGSNRTVRTTFSSPWLYREGAPRVLESASYMDLHFSGLGPKALTRSLAAEEFHYWLIPLQDRPFSLNSFYGGSLFDDSVGEIFAQHYAKVDSTAYFDIYQARGETVSSPPK